MAKTNSKPHDQDGLFTKSHILSVILFVVLYIFIGQLLVVFNSRTPATSINYDYDNKCYVLSEELDSNSTIFLDNHWMFFPNVTSDNVRHNFFNLDDSSAYPHAEHVSVSGSLGWNNLGSKAKWYHSPNGASFQDLSITGGNENHFAIYATRIYTPSGQHTFNINIPRVNGTYDIYCNGIQLKHVNDTSSRMGFNVYSETFENTTFSTDQNGYATIIIAVSVNDKVLNPGLLSIPSLSTQRYDILGLTMTSIGFAILILSFLSSIVCGFIISRTFAHKGKFYILLALEAIFLFYTMLDSSIILFYSPTLDILKYSLIMIMGILSFCIIELIFERTEDYKNNLVLKYDYLFIIAIGVALTLILVFNNNLLFTYYTTISASIFVLVGNAICIFKIIAFYNKNSLSTIVLNLYITMLFCFIYMFSPSMPIVNIKPYTSFYVIGIAALELVFIIGYVNQFYELRNSKDRLSYLVKEKTLHISEINRNLYNTNKRLLENEEARKNVLSNVSHDLRTPITAIRGYAELLISAGATMKEEQKQLYLQNIIKRSVQMERIVSDIVELTRMESNKDEFKFNDISVSELLDEIYMMYEGEVRGTTKKITLDLPEDDLLIVKADYKKLSRVFENLISNAINYTYDEALIKIKASREGVELPLSEQRIHITISDNGIGIPEEEIDNIFDRFYRAKNSGKNIKGTGLGLSIVSTIIKHHDADITVESKLGSGTTFHIVMKATY